MNLDGLGLGRRPTKAEVVQLALIWLPGFIISWYDPMASLPFLILFILWTKKVTS